MTGPAYVVRNHSNEALIGIYRQLVRTSYEPWAAKRLLLVRAEIARRGLKI